MRNLIADLVLPVPAGPLDGLAVEDLTDLPLDIPTLPDGDDRVHRPEPTPGVTAKKIVSQPLHEPKLALEPVRVVPFTRALYPFKSAGTDVTAVQRALRAAQARTLPPSGYFGPLMKKQVQEFQRRQGIDPTGNYGRKTHTALMPFFDAYGALLMQRWVAAHSAAQQRQEVVAAALFGVAHRDEIHYTQGPHRLDAIRYGWRPPKFPTATDCSGFATWCYFVPKLADPCGSGYDTSQAHYTGTLALNGVKVTAAKTGDLILYGHAWPYEHVTIAIDADRCVSHGSEPGPMVLPIRYRSDLAMIRSYLPR